MQNECFDDKKQEAKKLAINILLLYILGPLKDNKVSELVGGKCVDPLLKDAHANIIVFDDNIWHQQVSDNV